MRRFQSTRPVRGATKALCDLGVCVDISIHAPRAGRDAGCGDNLPALIQFQSTRPVRGATRNRPLPRSGGKISIHAPRAGRDPERRRASASRRHFNPRAPCGARLLQSFHTQPSSTFQSTRPVRGATTSQPRKERRSIFQSTRPVRGATPLLERPGAYILISIHAPRAGRDLVDIIGLLANRISIHAPRAGRDTGYAQANGTPILFQSTRPVRGATGKPATTA